MRSQLRARLWVALIGLSAAACAPRSHYMGIDLRLGTASDIHIQELASRAQRGDKKAQLELGIAFEEGAGVARDIKRARALYTRAAATSGGAVWVYVPPVAAGQSGRVTQVDTGPAHAGLEEARQRLERLND